MHDPADPLTTIISPTALLALMGSADAPLVLDASFDLADTGLGERAFAAAHIPGSHYVHLDHDLCAPRDGRNGRHPLPQRAAFAATAGRFGLAPGRQVVAVDGQGGAFAARLWWMLRWLGHDAVAVLDGGLAAWRAAGGAMTAQASPIDTWPPYPERLPLVTTVDATTVARRPPQALLIDARSGERFRGESEPIDPVAGHIPGAANRFHRSNLEADGRFKSASALRVEFETLLGERPASAAIHSCGSGVTACHNLLAMAHAGLDGARLYPGSWSEWSSDPARPIARG